MSVADHLAASRAAHLRFRQASGHITPQGDVLRQPEPRAMGEALRQALRARTEAHALDPAHGDPAWRLDAEQARASHDDLLDFYVRTLARA